MHYLLSLPPLGRQCPAYVRLPVEVAEQDKEHEVLHHAGPGQVPRKAAPAKQRFRKVQHQHEELHLNGGT